MTDLSPVDLVDPAAYADPDAIHALLKSLREYEPVRYVEPEGYRPFWAVTRFEDVRYIESNPELFVAGPRTVMAPIEIEQANLQIFGDINGVKTMVHMDGDEHKAYRALTRDWFSSKNLNLVSADISGLAKEFVDRMESMGGECDFAGDIAFWYPLRVVMRMIGVPEADEPDMLRLTQELFAADDADLARAAGASEMPPVINTLMEMSGYFTALAEKRRAEPEADIASVLANASINGEPLDPMTLSSYFIILATAGHDTTASAIAGGLKALIDNPEQFRKLRDDPELLALAADEMIRWTSTVKHFCRTATTDLELGGQQIRKGETLMVFFDSACRDETQFDNADQFIVDRKPNRHMAFGTGPHTCLGMHLAKMEVQAFFRELLPRLEHIEVAGQPGYTQSTFVSGLKSLPVRYRFRKSGSKVA